MAWSGNSAAITAAAAALVREASAAGGINREKWEALRKGVDYSETLPEQIERSGGSFWWTVLADLLKYGLALVIIVGLIFAVLKLIGAVKFSFGKKAAEADPDPEEEATAAETPLSALYAALEKAKADGNYREAIRLLYQIALKQLGEAGKVILKPEKTNRDYLNELRERDTAVAFGRLTRRYEYIWFGEGRAGLREYQKYAPEFNAFIKAADREK